MLIIWHNILDFIGEWKSKLNEVNLPKLKRVNRSQKLRLSRNQSPKISKFSHHKSKKKRQRLYNKI